MSLCNERTPASVRVGENSKARRTKDQFSLPIVGLIGSALIFSDRMVRVLNTEFADVRFCRFTKLNDLVNDERDPCLVLLHHAAAEDLAEAVRLVGERFDDTAIAIAYTSVGAAPRLFDGSLLTGSSVGLLPLNVSLDVLLCSLRLLLCGENFIPREIVEAWSGADAGGPTGSEGGGRGRAGASEPDVSLTRREMDILPLIADGKPNKAIAAELGLSEHTVRLHTRNIFRKLKVNNRTCAAGWYRTSCHRGGLACARTS